MIRIMDKENDRLVSAVYLLGPRAPVAFRRQSGERFEHWLSARTHLLYQVVPGILLILHSDLFLCLAFLACVFIRGR